MTDWGFTEQQNRTLLKLVRYMRGSGVASVIVGGALVASGLSLGAQGAPGFIAASRGGQGVAAILVGVIWWASSAGFHALTQTRGSDITELMNSIRALSIGFGFILGFALLLVALQGVIAASNFL